MPITQQNLSAEQGSIVQYIVHGFSATLPDGTAFGVEPAGAPVLSNIDGAPYVAAHLRLNSPARSGADLFDLRCEALLDRVPRQVTRVSIRTDWRGSTFANDPQLLGVLHGSDRSVRVDRRNGNWTNGFVSVFKLGLRHIAEGTDHLLFLLTLLLPAPLIALHGVWAGNLGIRRCLLNISKVVTAFTVGHSLTLAAGAMDLVHVPSRPIEVLIAASILVSAGHALRPVFSGKEAVIAGCFGLVHGLAFATTLAELGLDRWDRVASIFGFNLGIECMQLVVVAAALPALLLLSRTNLYKAVRTTGRRVCGSRGGRVDRGASFSFHESNRPDRFRGGATCQLDHDRTYRAGSDRLDNDEAARSRHYRPRFPAQLLISSSRN